MRSRIALRWPEDVAAHDEAEVTFLARLPDGPIHVLEPMAAAVWRQSLAGDREGIAERVASATGADAGEIRPDVEHTVVRLLALGLLEEELDATSADE